MPAMKLRDRLRRWWSPARWADDHPVEAHQRSERKGHRARYPGEMIDHGVSVERDFKKPR
jgi:hypothetical protein